jgi:hypothetical protein
MGEPDMDSTLYGEAQHLYRKREELEARVGDLCQSHMAMVVAVLDVWSTLPTQLAELVYGLIEMRLDEEALVEKMGPGWRVTDRGIAYSPLWGSEPLDA